MLGLRSGHEDFVLRDFGSILIAYPSVAMCPLCLQCDASLTHLMRVCEATRPYLEPLSAAKGGMPLDVEDLSCMPSLEEMQVAVRVSGALLRATLDAVGSQTKDPVARDSASHLVPASAVMGDRVEHSCGASSA